jgi:peptidoglycan hydrolase CwlO-like protein
MSKFTIFAIILLILYSSQANKTELWETAINDLKEEFNYRLNNAIKIQEIYERRVEEMVKQFSGFNDKLYDINNKVCHSGSVNSVINNEPPKKLNYKVNEAEENISEFFNN